MLKKCRYAINSIIINDTHLKNQIKAWRKDKKDYPRIAQALCLLNPQLYHDRMVAKLDPPNHKKAVPYFHVFSQLGISKILTTNFDLLLESALYSKGWRPCNWADEQELNNSRYSPNPMIFHIHGDILRFGTLVHKHSEFYEFKGPKGNSMRSLLLELFKANRILTLGYGLGDPFIQWVKVHLQHEGNLQPRWMQLLPESEKEAASSLYDEHKIVPVYYKVENEDHASGLTQWFKELAVAADFPLAESTFQVEVANPAIAWKKISMDFLQRLPKPTNDEVVEYYQGQEVDWSMVFYNQSVEREQVEMITKRSNTLMHSKNEMYLALVILGAGGEGKSTLLKQCAVNFVKQGWKLFFSDSGLDPLPLLQHTGPLAVVMDHGDDTPNLGQVLQKFKNRGRNHPTLLLFAARANEWKEIVRWNKQIQSNNYEELTISKLCRQEAEKLTALLVNRKLLPTPEDAAQKMMDNYGGYLLATMLQITQGLGLKDRLADMVVKVKNMDQGQQLLQALALVAIFESKVNKNGEAYYCSFRLFQRFFEQSNADMRQMCARLVGELRIRITATRKVVSRHPVIGAALAEVIFGRDLIDSLELEEDILQIAGDISKEEFNPGERKLLSMFPIHYQKQKKDIPRARRLFQRATLADSNNAPKVDPKNWTIG